MPECAYRTVRDHHDTSFDQVLGARRGSGRADEPARGSLVRVHARGLLSLRLPPSARTGDWQRRFAGALADVLGNYSERLVRAWETPDGGLLVETAADLRAHGEIFFRLVAAEVAVETGTEFEGPEPCFCSHRYNEHDDSGCGAGGCDCTRFGCHLTATTVAPAGIIAANIFPVPERVEVVGTEPLRHPR